MSKTEAQTAGTVLAIFCMLLLAGCGSKQNAAQAAGAGGPAAMPPPDVTVAVAKQEAVPVTIDAIGNAQPVRSVQLKSLVDGQISRVLLQQGEYVRKGELLFELDKRPFQAAVDQALGKLAQDKATAAYNQAQANRDKVLEQEGVIAPQVLQEQESLAQSNAATVQADQAAVENARVNLSYTDIRAPIDARAGAILVNVGNTVQANSTSPLAILNQIVPIYVQFNVPEAQLPAIRAGGIGKLKVNAFPPGITAPAVGTLTFVNNAVDMTTGTIQLMGTFPNADQKLWPGEFLNVSVLLGTDQRAIVVPATAVQTGQQGKYVYVVHPDGTAALQPVTSPRNYRELAVITNGVQPGQSVIVAGQFKVIPNTKVQVVKTVPVEPAPLQPSSSAQQASAGESSE